MRLIDADATRKAIFALVGDEAIKQYADQKARTRSNDHYLDALIDADDVIDDMPTINPVKHGRWVRDDIDKWRCSECGVGNNYAYKWSVSGDELQDKYCPNCGARMDGGEDE